MAKFFGLFASLAVLFAVLFAIASAQQPSNILEAVRGVNANRNQNDQVINPAEISAVPSKDGGHDNLGGKNNANNPAGSVLGYGSH